MKRTAAGRAVVWLALENDVPDFRMQGATQRSGWPRQSGADACANGQISDRVIPLSRAEPVFSQRGGVDVCVYRDRSVKRLPQCLDEIAACPSGLCRFELLAEAWIRSEEHTSELQSLMRISYAVLCLKKKIYYHNTNKQHY